MVESANDIHRNSIVSVFLRVLEYYTGILFLTSNRVTTFDDAFRLRIQVPIRYTHLNLASGVKIWRTLLQRVPGGADAGEYGIRLLARHRLNGRQIKNAVKAAEGLARVERVKVGLHQLQQVTEMQAAFHKDMTHIGGVDYTAPEE